MARPLTFQFGESEIAVSTNKIDRAKLYGYKDLEVLDSNDLPCELATLADDGRTIVGKGGIAQGWLDADGAWCDKSSLQPVNGDNQPIQPVGSSFDAPIKLFETATIEEYLQHNIRLVYSIESEDNLTELHAELKRGTIFSFPYSFRGGLQADAGFLLTNEQGEIMMVVGNPTQPQFIGLQTSAVAEEEESTVEDFDCMDFDMI